MSGEHERPMRSACARSAWRILRAIMIDLLNIQKLVRFVGCTACLVHGGCSVCAAKVGKKRQSTKSFLLNFHFFCFHDVDQMAQDAWQGLMPAAKRHQDARCQHNARTSHLGCYSPMGQKTWGCLLQQFFQLLAESLAAALHVRSHDLTLVVKQIDRGDRLHLEQVGAVLSVKVRSDN